MVAPALHDSLSVGPLRVGLHVCESGYRGVYRHHNGWWRPRAKVLGVLRDVGPACPTPSAAAVYVARWYAERYGPGWPAAVRRRKGRPRPYRAWWSRMRGAWVLWVWEFGSPVEVRERGRRGRWTARTKLFPTRAAAEAYAPVYARLRWGLFAPVVVARDGGQVPPAGGTIPDTTREAA